MDAFLQHVGSPGVIDIGFTVTRQRSISEILHGLPAAAPERRWFEAGILQSAFPEGEFNCWGVPSGAKPRFRETQVGDLFLMFPHVGANGGLAQIGVVRALCPNDCSEASRLLWPRTPDHRLFPWIFFFRTEVGFREWSDFLRDMGYAENWDPRGQYRRIAADRLGRWGGADGYLQFLRGDCGFKAPTDSA
jgi:hypothetical protein